MQLDSPDDERSTHPLALILFALYVVGYAAFVVLCAFKPTLMAQRPFGGCNAAVWSGLALIVVPLLLAAIYAVARRGDAS